jgi:predicted NBD/HSP70 family sugar kinase
MTDARIRPNQRRIISLLACDDGLSRAALARRLALPKATVTDLVNDLITRGLVVETDIAAPVTAGRPARTLALTGPPPAIGIAVWSTGLLRVAVATRSGRILADTITMLDPGTPRAGLLEPAIELVQRAADAAGYTVDALDAVVLGVPAPFQRGVGMPVRRPADGSPGVFASWLHDDPAATLSRRLGTAVLVENDANLGALGEFVFGAGRDRSSLIYVKLGEHSVGAGLIINGWLHRGASGFAGELAHIQVDPDGPLCACGGRGCLIQVIGSGLIESVQPAYEQKLTYPRMLALAADGDTGMRRILGDLGRSIGRPLADVTTMLNPAAIVIDGMVGPAGGHIIDGIADALGRHAAPGAVGGLEIVAGELGERADLLGAVALMQREA